MHNLRRDPVHRSNNIPNTATTNTPKKDMDTRATTMVIRKITMRAIKI